MERRTRDGLTLGDVMERLAELLAPSPEEEAELQRRQAAWAAKTPEERAAVWAEFRATIPPEGLTWQNPPRKLRVGKRGKRQ